MSGLKTWPIYVKLQTEIAYGGGLGGANRDTQAINEAAGEYAQRVGNEVPVERSLVIGPGGVDEVRALRGRLGGVLHVLTAHHPEVEAIREAAIQAVIAEPGDIHDTHYHTGAFGFLHAANVLEHAFAPYIALTECRRILRPGGIASFVLPSFEGREGGRGPFHLHCLTKEVWMELLHKTGFEVADAIRQDGLEDPTGHYMHYRCVATTPPHPHDQILRELITYKATQP